MSDVRLVATNPDDNTLVPVAANASGQLAVQSPKIEKVPNDLDVEGDLTVSGRATLKTTLFVEGDATLFNTNILLGSSYGKVNPFKLSIGSSNESSVSSGTGTKTYKWEICETGNEFGHNLTFNAIRRGLPDFTAFSINGVGGASFAGDVVVSSRGKKWMLVEQGGLCHMVEQVQASTADLVDPAADLVDPAAVTEYPKLRDVFAELNVIERALEDVMEKLRMTEPEGWPVWDGSDNSR